MSTFLDDACSYLTKLEKCKLEAWDQMPNETGIVLQLDGLSDARLTNTSYSSCTWSDSVGRTACQVMIFTAAVASPSPRSVRVELCRFLYCKGPGSGKQYSMYHAEKP